MSIQGVWGDNCRIIMSCPGITNLGSGAYTAAILFRPNDFQSVMIWRAYQSDNFSYRGLYVGGDGKMWVPNQEANTNIPNYSIPPTKLYWFVLTKSSLEEPARAHYAEYREAEDLTWFHVDASGIQNNRNIPNRVELGDEFDSEFRGTVACFAISNQKLTDIQIEETFVRSSNIILSQNMGFFAHWPQANGTSSSLDIASGGIEIARTGTWTLASDPPGYNFDLGPAPRSGHPKVWNGNSWVEHPTKGFNGSGWIPYKIYGYDGTEWVTSK